MSLFSAAAAIKLFLRKLEVAQDMAKAGAVGEVLRGVLSEADNLLGIVDEELAGIDRQRHASLFTTTMMLHRKLDHLRTALQNRRQRSRESIDFRPLNLPDPNHAVLVRKLYEDHCTTCKAAGVTAPTPERWVDLIDDMLRPRP